MKEILKLVNLSIILAILCSVTGFFLYLGYGDKTGFFNALFLDIMLIYLLGFFLRKLLK